MHLWILWWIAQGPLTAYPDARTENGFMTEHTQEPGPGSGPDAGPDAGPGLRSEHDAGPGPDPSRLDPDGLRNRLLGRIQPWTRGNVAGESPERRGHPPSAALATEARPSCPRCGTPRAHRWGSFSGRQRWRCTRCRRTFSTFTGSLLEGVRRLDAWEEFAHHLSRDESVRAAACRVGVHKNTAHRWRMRLLSALRHPCLENVEENPPSPGDGAHLEGHAFILPVMGRHTLPARLRQTLPDHRNPSALLVLCPSSPLGSWRLAEIVQVEGSGPGYRALSIGLEAYRHLATGIPILLSAEPRLLRIHGPPPCRSGIAQMSEVAVGALAGVGALGVGPVAIEAAAQVHRLCRETGVAFRRWFFRFRGIDPSNAEAYLDWFVRVVLPADPTPLRSLPVPPPPPLPQAYGEMDPPLAERPPPPLAQPAPRLPDPDPDPDPGPDPGPDPSPDRSTSIRCQPGFPITR
jgi:transposase-like protein